MYRAAAINGQKITTSSQGLPTVIFQSFVTGVSVSLGLHIDIIVACIAKIDDFEYFRGIEGCFQTCYIGQYGLVVNNSLGSGVHGVYRKICLVLQTKYQKYIEHHPVCAQLSLLQE